MSSIVKRMLAMKFIVSMLQEPAREFMAAKGALQIMVPQRFGISKEEANELIESFLNALVEKNKELLDKIEKGDMGVFN